MVWLSTSCFIYHGVLFQCNYNFFDLVLIYQDTSSVSCLIPDSVFLHTNVWITWLRQLSLLAHENSLIPWKRFKLPANSDKSSIKAFIQQKPIISSLILRHPSCNSRVVQTISKGCMSDTAFSYSCNNLAKEEGAMENSSSLHHYMEIKRLPHAIMRSLWNKEGEVIFDPTLLVWTLSLVE